VFRNAAAGDEVEEGEEESGARAETVEISCENTGPLARSDEDGEGEGLGEDEDEDEGDNNKKRKKRKKYHRHTAKQIREMEA